MALVKPGFTFENTRQFGGEGAEIRLAESIFVSGMNDRSSGAWWCPEGAFDIEVREWADADLDAKFREEFVFFVESQGELILIQWNSLLIHLDYGDPFPVKDPIDKDRSDIKLSCPVGLVEVRVRQLFDWKFPEQYPDSFHGNSYQIIFRVDQKPSTRRYTEIGFQA